MKIDCHVHVVGNGSSGSGCWYRPRGLTRLGAPFLLRSVGLPQSALTGDLDRLYAEKLREFVRGSGLDAALLLAQDDTYLENGKRLENFGSFFVPNSFVLKLAAEHREFLAAISIHPARADALEELERCIAGGAVALKCLPNCQNIDWGNPRYTRFLERMAEAGLVLLAHTGSERTLPVFDAKLASPEVLRRPLEIGVTCIAAHCGTGTMLLDPDYFDEWCAMTQRFKNLYGDNSALAALNFRFRPSALRKMLQPEIACRILHGSDVPVPVSGALLFALGMLSWREHRAATAEKNPIARDAILKRSLGFPEETFSRFATLLPKERLSQRT